MCTTCGRQTSVTAGTIFHRIRTPLSTWFAAIWFLTSQKNGMSALGLQRVLGFGSYETAWAWLQKLRRAMVRPDRDLLSGVVELDEVFVGNESRGAAGDSIAGLGFGVYMAVDLALVVDVLPDKDNAAKDLGGLRRRAPVPTNRRVQHRRSPPVVHRAGDRTCHPGDRSRQLQRAVRVRRDLRHHRGRRHPAVKRVR